MSFDPQQYIMKLKKGKKTSDYLEVKYRLLWLLSDENIKDLEHTIIASRIEPDMEIERQEVQIRDGYAPRIIIQKARGWAWYHVRIKVIYKDGTMKTADGTKSESALDFPDYAEKAETGAGGRALAKLGYGTEASGFEFDEEHRIVDSPSDKMKTPTRSQTANSQPAHAQASTSTQPAEQTPLERKRATACKMAQMLGIKEPPTQMDEKALDDFIKDCKRENAARQQSQQQEAVARAELEKVSAAQS